MSRGKLFRCAMVALTLSFAWVPAASAEQAIIADGKPNAEIVIAPEAVRQVELAARDLQVYLEKITDARLPIRTEPGAAEVKIYVGRSRHTDELGIEAEDLRHGGFRVKSGPNYLALVGRDRPFQRPPIFANSRNDAARALEAWDEATGEKFGLPYASLYKGYNKDLDIWEKDERGSYNAVVHFLRGLGVRWYMPHELGEVVPRRGAIALPALDETVRPDFPVRWPHQYRRRFGGRWTTETEALWQWRMGWNQAPDVIGWGFGAHGLNMVTAREEVKKAHPDYYALYGGKRNTDFRHSGKPCLSSEDLFQATLRYCRDMYDIMGAPMVSVMPADALTSICQCEKCRGKDTPERGWRGALSDYVWGFVNRVATEMYKTHPDKKIVCATYGTYRLPPEKIDKFSPNVVVRLNQHRNTFGDPAHRQARTEFLNAWLEKLPEGRRSIIATGPLRPGAPYPAFFPHGVAWNVRSLKNVALGEVMEVTRSANDGVDAMAALHLNLYVMSRMWWDADLDADALLEEYYQIFYGPAANAMKQFILYSEKNWTEMSRDTERIDTAFELLSAARAKAPADSVYGRRIELIAQFMEPLRAVRAEIAAGRQDLPAIEVVVLDNPEMSVDGKLDEPAWSQCPALEMREILNDEKPQQRTTVKVFWDDKTETVNFGFKCFDENVENLTVIAKENDAMSLWNGDYVEVLLETPSRAYYQIAVNPLGVMTDMDRGDRRKEIRWDSGAKAAAHVGEGYWSVELRVPTTTEKQAILTPLEGVAGTKPTRERPWHVNACRVRRSGRRVEASVLSSTGEGRREFHDTRRFARFHVVEGQ